MTTGEERARWEYELQEQIYAENAWLRVVLNASGGGINWDAVRKSAKELGIDPRRAECIARAAKADIDWHSAIRDMQI